jgi:hypothetical protein
MFDVALSIRLRGAAAVTGIVLGGVLVVALAAFLLFGNGTVSRVLWFPAEGGKGAVAEERRLPRHLRLEDSAAELASGVLLGPARSDAERLFPRGARVDSVFLVGRTLLVDLSPLVLQEDVELHVRGQAALDLLARTLRDSFPRVREIVFTIDGQVPRFRGEEKI